MCPFAIVKSSRHPLVFTFIRPPLCHVPQSTITQAPPEGAPWTPIYCQSLASIMLCCVDLLSTVRQPQPAPATACPSHSLPQPQPAPATACHSHSLPQPQPALATACHSYSLPQLQPAIATACHSHSLPQPQPATATAYYSHSLPQPQPPTATTMPLVELPAEVQQLLTAWQQVAASAEVSDSTYQLICQNTITILTELIDLPD